MQGIAGLIDRQRHHIELNIGTAADRVFRASGTTDLPRTCAQRAAACEQPLQTHLGKARGASNLIVQRDPLLQSDNHARLVVILQIAADFRRVGDNGNAKPPQQIRRTDAGQLQQLRRLQRAGRHSTTSRSAAALNTWPFLIHSTPVATRPLNTTLLTCAPVMTVRFGRRAMGRKKADAELLRQWRPMPS